MSTSVQITTTITTGNLDGKTYNDSFTETIQAAENIRAFTEDITTAGFKLFDFGAQGPGNLDNISKIILQNLDDTNNIEIELIDSGAKANGSLLLPGQKVEINNLNMDANATGSATLTFTNATEINVKAITAACRLKIYAVEIAP